MCWKTYELSRSKVEVIAPFTMDMHRKKVSAYRTLGTERKQKSGRGGKRIVTLTGWTHRLHTNTNRKCVSILCIAEHSITNFNGGEGEHSHTEKRRVEGQMR